MIEEFGFGMITVDGYAYGKDLIILPRTVIENWHREEGHLLQLKDIEAHIQDVTMDVLVVGTGKFGFLKIHPDIHIYVHENKIDFYHAALDKAVDKFNDLLTSGKRVVGVFHLTC